MICLAITDDSKYYITGSDNKSIKIFDFEKNDPILFLENAHAGFNLRNHL